VRTAFLIAVTLATAACGSSPQAAPKSVSIGAGLKGRQGLHASVYARGIPQMSAFAFDARGRLWVTRSGSSSHGSDGVYVVDSAGATPTRVVHRIRGPLGLVWIGRRLYVSHLGGVERFSGFSEGAFASRTTILEGPVAGAENNNLVLAPDGRLVMGVSATCDHCANTPRYSGAIVSFRTDGSGLELLATGIRAAYGLVYDGDSLYVSMNQRDDLGARTPGDWLARVERAQDWGFPACYGQGGRACAGVPSPLGVLDAHAAAGGVAIAGDDVLVTEWVLGTVMSVPSSGGRATELVSGLAHPLPIVRAADRWLLVGDWGTGVIYRITGV
jgi:glucose/arabinose dehydrogenase